MRARHVLAWQDDGMGAVRSCDGLKIEPYLDLTAPDGPMNDGTEGDDHYARVCPVCGMRVILRWSVRVEVLDAEAPDAR